jgi:hypothetical protein
LEGVFCGAVGGRHDGYVRGLFVGEALGWRAPRALGWALENLNFNKVFVMLG